MSRHPKATPLLPPEGAPLADLNDAPAGAKDPEQEALDRERATLEAELAGQGPTEGAPEPGPEPPTASFDFSPAMCRKVLAAASKFAGKRLGAKWEADADELDMLAPLASDVMNEYVAPWLPEFLSRHGKLIALGGGISFYLLPRLLDEDEPPQKAAPGAPAADAA